MVYWSRGLTQEIALEIGEGMGWERPGQEAVYEASHLCGHSERDPPGDFGKQHVVHLRVIPTEQGYQSITPGVSIPATSSSQAEEAHSNLSGVSWDKSRSWHLEVELCSELVQAEGDTNRTPAVFMGSLHVSGHWSPRDPTLGQSLFSAKENLTSPYPLPGQH